MNEKEINPKIIRDKILKNLNQINLERTPLQKGEQYTHLNNYGYLDLRKLTPQMVELSNEIKDMITDFTKEISGTFGNQLWDVIIDWN